jgi:hypothetical protein
MAVMVTSHGGGCRTAFFSWLTLILMTVGFGPVRADDTFAKVVQPIFKARCASCHDGRKGVAEFRVDLRTRAFAGGESKKKGLVAGDRKKSEIYQRIASDDEDVRMPPEGDPLTKAEVEAIGKWIDAGAVWPDSLAGDDGKSARHWAFQPPVRPTPPGIPAKYRGLKRSAAESAIDRFVLARLAKERLKPSPEADRVTLARRLYLDLVGLPPSPAELDEWLADTRPGAYERLVEKLLASPHYGERQGRLWLDGARYADSDGFEKDKQRFVWFYRDWVVSAFNRDLPYDRFVIEQLAGDRLPNPTQDQLVATGFLRNSMINEEGGIDPEQFRMEAMFDRMDAIGKSVLGLTISCSQCHNHKYDPISQAEYYGMFAFLNNDEEGSITVYTADEQRRRADILRKTAELEAELRHRHPDWLERMAEWETKTLADQTDWRLLKPELDTSGGQKHTVLPDGSILASGYAPTKMSGDFSAPTDLEEISAFRLELLNHGDLPRHGPGRSIFGTFGLTEVRIEIAPANNPGQKKSVKIISASADANPPETALAANFDDNSKRKRTLGPIGFAMDGKDETAWGIDVGGGRSNVPRNAVFNFAEPMKLGKGQIVTVHLVQNHGGWNSDDNQNNNLGRFRLSVTSRKDASADLVPKAVRELMLTPPARRSDAARQAIFAHYRTTVPEWKQTNDAIEKLWATHPLGTSQLVLSKREMTRDTRLLKRGDFLKPAEKIKPTAPAVLNPIPEGGSEDRLTFARWMVDRRSPTTARAFVNRVWQQYFGIGLVSTSEDLGVQCEPPSHPELLDWLAVEFMEPSVATGAKHPPKPWSMKHLHRLIVLSNTYRQTSAVTPEALARDPYNRLLARASRFRVDAELVRDIQLAASGLLTRTIGGPPAYPPLPGFMILPPVSYGPKIWPEAKGPERYRRALYTHRYRSLPYPLLQTFDAPVGDFSCVKRSRSNTPLQALVLLNETISLEAARGLMREITADPDLSCHGRLTLAFRRCTGRVPFAAELQELERLFGEQYRAFGQPGAKPWDLAADDPAKPPALPKHLTQAGAAAWTAVCRVLLNLDETITRE